MADKIQYCSEENIKKYYESLTTIINEYLHYHREDKRKIAKQKFVNLIRDLSMQHLKASMDMALKLYDQGCFATIQEELGIEQHG